MKEKFIIRINLLIMCLSIVICIAVPLINASVDEGTYVQNETISNEQESNNQEVVIEEESPQHIETVPDGYIGIYSVGDFEYIRTNSNYNYILMNDIDFSGVEDWIRVSVDGVFNGNNYTISNFTSNDSLFYEVTGSLTDLSLVGVKIQNNDDTGGLCEKLVPITYNNNFTSEGVIRNCHVSGDITVNIGGLFPQYSELNSSVKSSVNIGGIAGSIHRNSDDYEPTIENCSFEGNIQVICDYKGGKIKIGDSLAVRVGGIVGDYYAKTLQDCEADGSIDIQKLNSDDSGEYTSIMVGGIVGNARGSINWVKSNMNITSNFDAVSAGGIAGNPNGSGIYSCYNSGNINLKSNSTYAGGICGGRFNYTIPDIINCYNNGTITAGTAGGLSGCHCCIKSSYNIGKVSGTEKAGALSVNKNEVMEYCYYLEDGLPITADGGKYPYSKGLSAQEMKTQSSFEGFDFGRVWQFSDGEYPYPTLVDRP